MTTATTVTDAHVERLELARAALNENPDGVVEAVARQFQLPTLSVLNLLPQDTRTFAPREKLQDIWSDISSWGEILFIIHTPDIVLECSGVLPSGSDGHGYFNFHGDSPIGGHLKADNCTSICFVDRVFHGRRSCSVQFFNAAGEPIFKIFVRRDAKRKLVPDQVARFESLAAAMRDG